MIKFRLIWVKFIFFFLLVPITKQDLLSSMNSFCSNANIEEIHLSPKEWDDQRRMRENKFYPQYDKVVAFAKDQSKLNEFMSAFTAEAVLMFLLLVLIIIGLVVFSIHCCCNLFSIERKMDHWMMISSVLLVVFLLLFIVFVVFISMSQYKYDSVVCLIYRFPGGLVEGFQDANGQFLGIKGLLKTYQGFNDELGQLVVKGTSFATISNQNFQSQTDQSQQSLLSFQSTAVSKTVMNMSNKNAVTNSAYSFLNIIRPQIDEEFYSLSTVGTRLNVASKSDTQINGTVFQPILIAVTQML